MRNRNLRRGKVVSVPLAFQGFVINLGQLVLGSKMNGFCDEEGGAAILLNETSVGRECPRKKQVIAVDECDAFASDEGKRTISRCPRTAVRLFKNRNPVVVRPQNVDGIIRKSIVHRDDLRPKVQRPMSRRATGGDILAD